MRTYLRGGAGVILVLAATTGVATQNPVVPMPPGPAPTVQELFVTQTFQQRVDEYVTLHRMLEGPLPPLTSTRDVALIRADMQLLAKRIVLARSNAQQGDIITPDVGRMFRRRIATCLTPEQWDAVLAELAEDEEGVRIPRVELHVNMTWPESVPYGFVPPQLLMALPPLPPELQYRIIGRSLVLWDHHANLIVDFMPGAFTT